MFGSARAGVFARNLETHGTAAQPAAGTLVKILKAKREKSKNQTPKAQQIAGFSDRLCPLWDATEQGKTTGQTHLNSQ
jgi:hypothetical protein